MAIRPRNCVFVSGVCRDDGDGNHGNCVAAYHLTGALHAPLIDVVMDEEWGDFYYDDENFLLDIAREGNTLYVLVGAHQLGYLSYNIYQFRELRIYGVDVSDPANMTVLPGYVDVVPLLEEIAEPANPGYWFATELKVNGGHLAIGIGQYSARPWVAPLEHSLWWCMAEVTDGTWPPTMYALDDRALLYRNATDLSMLLGTTSGWDVVDDGDPDLFHSVTTMRPGSHAVWPAEYNFSPGTWIPGPFEAWNPAGSRANQQIAFAQQQVSGVGVYSATAGALGGTPRHTIYLRRNTVIGLTQPWGLALYSDRIEGQSTLLYAATDNREQPWTFSQCVAVGDDSVMFYGDRQDYFRGWSVEAEDDICQSDKQGSFRQNWCDADAESTWVAVKIDTIGQLIDMFPGYSIGWALFDAAAITQLPHMFDPERMKGIAGWRADYNPAVGGAPASSGYYLELFGNGIVAGVPVRGGRRVDTYTDPTGIEWTVLLKDSNIIVVRPDTSSTYASPVTVDSTGNYDDVSITGNGTVLTIEARSADDDGLWRWRSDRYGLADTWTGPTEVPTT